MIEQVNPLGINPVLLNIPMPSFMPMNELQIRWYGLMYVLGFIWAGFVLRYLHRTNFLKLNSEEIEKYISNLIIGMFIGARVFYVFIYNWDSYSQDFSRIFAVWEGGLSFHGAVVGMCIVTWFTARKKKLHFFELSDSMAVGGTLGLGFGRLGNFINGELFGRITDSPIGMVFTHGGPMARHPSQLYEALLEGLVLFLVLWYAHKKEKIYGIVSTLFLAGYGFARYIVEFFREADVQMGYYFGGTTTMGQILCLLMIAFSFVIYALAKKANVTVPARKTANFWK